MTGKKSAARRGRKRRAKYDRAVFASPEAARLAGKVAEEFDLGIPELLGTIRAYDARPTGSGGQWRVGDIRAGLAAYERWQQEFSKSLEPLVDPALAAQRAAVGEAMDEFEYAVVCECGLYVPERDLERHRQEDCPGPAILPDSAEEAETDVRPLPNPWQRFTGWVRRQWEVLPDRRLPLLPWPHWLIKPSWPSRPQIRVPEGVRNTWGHLDRWLTAGGDNRKQAIRLGGTIALVLLVVAVVGAAGLLVALRGIAVALAPAPAPTQVAAAVATFTPVPASTVVVEVIGTVTPVPPTPEPTATPVGGKIVAPTEEPPAPSPIILPAPAEPVTTTTTITVTGHIANGGGMEVVLFAGSDIVASTTTDAGGNYIFTNVTEGAYAVVVGEATPTAITVATGAETVTVPAFHRVVKGDTLWDIYGAHSWSDFTAFADAHGLKHYEAGGKLVVVIQPGMVFNLAEMPAAG